MKIHGVRIYRSGLRRIFQPVAAAWHDCIFANEFGVRLGANGSIEDPLPGLRRTYGTALLATDVPRHLALLRGSEFDDWSAAVSFCEGALLPIFSKAPAFEAVKRLYWDRAFELNSETWPTEMRALLHMWDGVYWQLFSTVQSDVTALIRAHSGDAKAKMCFVDLDREYPDPSNAKLEPATLEGKAGNA